MTDPGSHDSKPLREFRYESRVRQNNGKKKKNTFGKFSTKKTFGGDTLVELWKNLRSLGI